jgi:hypothetical protein
MSRKISSISLSPELHARIQEKVKEEGRPFSEIVKDAVEMYLELDPMLMKSAKRLAMGLGISPTQVIQRFAIRVFAEDQASREVYGKSTLGLNKLFMWETDESEENIDLMNGDDLYFNLKRKFVERFQEKADEKEPRLKEWRKKLAAMEKRIEEIKQYQDK